MSFYLKNKQNSGWVVTATKPQSGLNDRSSQWKNWNFPSSMLLKSLRKSFFKVQWSLVLIPFQNGDNKSILKILEKQLNVTYVPHILKEDIEGQTELVASIKN